MEGWRDADVRVEDAAVCALGVCASLAVAVPWLIHPVVPVGYALGFLAAVLVLSRMPANLPSRLGPVEISFTPAALVFLALRTSTGMACTLWFLASVVHRISERNKPATDRVFNIGCVSAAGVAALLVLSLRGPVLGARTALVVAAACAVFFMVDMWLTTASMARSQQRRHWALLPEGLMVIPLLVFVGIDSLGYLAAVLDLVTPKWMLCLLLPPLVTIFVASRSQSRASESERRTSAVYAIARATTSIDNPADMSDVLVGELQELLPGREVTIGDLPPNEHQIGAQLRNDGLDAKWVIVGLGNGYAFRDGDRLAVETLARVASDMLDRRRLLDELARMARVDALTGLANRTTLVNRLEQAADTLAPGSDSTCAVLYCDVDGFKGINDRLGHSVGDRAIVATADRLRSSLRDDDVAARLSGDEFAMVLTDVDRAAAVAMAERVVASFDTPLDVDGRPLQVGVSVGVALMAAGDTAEAVIKDADTAMYAAKQAGRGRAALFDPDSRRALERELVLEDDLRTALANETLWLAWQPVVNLTTSELDGFEVLIRWTHPQFGNIAPDVLLPIASRIGLMPALGRWILVSAMEGGLTLAAAAGRPISIAVNVAAEQLSDERFIELASEYAADRRVRLVLELTEHTLINGEAATTVLDQLHTLGAAISLDDFGSGYSSIDYLHRFRAINAIKIDRSFIGGLVDNARTQAVVDSVTTMARAFEVWVVAEGVEDWESARIAFELGCQLGQGYLFGRPEPIGTALAIATSGRIEGAWPWLANVTPLPARSPSLSDSTTVISNS